MFAYNMTLGTYEIHEVYFRNSCCSVSIKTVNGTGLKLCTQVGYHDGSCRCFDNLISVHAFIMGRYVCVLQASGNTYMKLCMRAMPTITIKLQVCKQQQIASGTSTCASFFGTLVHHITLMTKRRFQVCKQQQTASGIKLTFLPITWLPYVLPLILCTLAHHIQLMQKPQLQVCKQQQTTSGNKSMFIPVTCSC